MGLATLLVVLVPVIKVVNALRLAARGGNVLEVSPGGIVLEERGAWTRRRVEIPAQEIVGVSAGTVDRQIEAARDLDGAKEELSPRAASGAASDARSVAWEAYDTVTKTIGASSPHMSYDEYYSRFLVQLVPKRTLQYNAVNRQNLGLEGDERKRCVDYFDSHQQKRHGKKDV